MWTNRYDKYLLINEEERLYDRTKKSMHEFTMQLRSSYSDEDAPAALADYLHLMCGQILIIWSFTRLHILRHYWDHNVKSSLHSDQSLLIPTLSGSKIVTELASFRWSTRSSPVAQSSSLIRSLYNITNTMDQNKHSKMCFTYQTMSKTDN